MHVVHIITGLATGGAERMLQDRVLRTRHRVDIISLSVDGEIAAQLREAGFRVHHLAMSSNTDVRSVQPLVRLLKQLKPDVVHVHLYRASLYGRLAARLAGVKTVIATEHSALPDSTEGRAATRGVVGLYRAAERLGTLTIAVSKTTRDILIEHWGIDPDRVIVVPNGIDTHRWRLDDARRAVTRQRYGFTDDTKVVVGAGRFVQGKRFDLLIESLAQLEPNVHLMIAGDGPMRGQLQQLAVDFGVSERTHFVGVLDDMAEAFIAGDVFASASQVETYGIAIVEAYVAGLPVAYVMCPAVSDLAPSASRDRLFESPATAEGMAASITAAMKQPWGWQHVSEEDRLTFDIDAVCSTLDDIEEQLGAGVAPVDLRS